MSTYQVSNQSDSINRIKAGYGGSDSTKASFNRSKYVKYNTFQKAKDLGLVSNIKATITGVIGTETGTNTHYYKFETIASSDIRIYRNDIASQIDKYISVGLLDNDRKPVQLNNYGFGYNTEILNTEIKEKLLTLPLGVYYFTVSSSQWQTLPYSIDVQVIRYLNLEGSASGAMVISTRIALVKMWGTALGLDQTSATMPADSKIKKLDGPAGGTDSSYGEIAGLFGSIGGTILTTGRMKATWRLEGSATGVAPISATLTASSGGGGYP